MELMEQSTRGFALRTAITVVMVCSAVLVTMRAGNAERGGATRNALSFAGTLRRNGACAPETTLAFRFKKRSAPMGPFVAVAGCAPEATARPAAGTCAFQVEIPMSGCPGGMFDGEEVVFDVMAGADVVAAEQQVNPVPYAKYADRVGTPDCPVGYDRDEREAGIVLCRKCRGPGRFEACYDDVVRVGTGASAFWIDRYEASVWSNGNGTGNRLPPYPTTFPQNGRWTVPFFATSMGGTPPTTDLTWFQVAAACRISGKRLPTGDEWITAAMGTDDPSTPSDGASGECRTQGTFRDTGRGVRCVSRWGAQDMIGNVRELTGEWYASAGMPTSVLRDGGVTVPATETVAHERLVGVRVNNGLEFGGTSYGDDLTFNVSSTVVNVIGNHQMGSPAVATRGGGPDETAAGVYLFDLDQGPAFHNVNTGFRCVIPR